MWNSDDLMPDGPRYRALADRIAGDVAGGRLQPGEQLPPQRELARALGLDVTTVTRGYREAARRGLVHGEVGRGTFVSGPSIDAKPGGAELAAPAKRDDGALDLALNIPPRLTPDPMGAALSRTLGALHGVRDLSGLLEYHYAAGHLAHREAAAAWVGHSGIVPDPARIVVVSGAQHGLASTISALARPGGILLTEEVTYPGIRALAEQLALRLVGVPVDEDGITPEGLRAACAATGATLLCFTPTLQNPTSSIMPRRRREQIAEVALEHRLTLIEDDVYGALVEAPPPPFASLLPESTYYATSLSKTVSPGLRTGYVVAPSERGASRVAASVLASTRMAAPLTCEIATSWIRDGTALRLLHMHREAARARQKIAATLLASRGWSAHPEGYHGWLKLESEWSGAELALHARRAGVLLTPGAAFAVPTPGGLEHPERSVRISVSAPRDLASLEQALSRLCSVLDAGPEEAHSVV
ncbi:MAG: PLP-dependent aminotransferase family protein [Gemmatimonadetes bacterium]|nr:PLP-dependent aminotransferase family protein [Gemmatimonadota bacterium]